MDCREVMCSSFFNITSTSTALFCRGPLLARCAHKLPISASSAVKPHSSSSTSTRILSSSVHMDPRVAERKFAHNADHDLRVMCEEGQLKEAVVYVELMHKGGLQLSPKSYAFLLQQCANSKALDEGKKVHALLVTTKIQLDVIIRNNLLSMYVKCGCLNEAKLMFEAMGTLRDVVSWTIIMNACAQHGQIKEAIKLYFTMRKRGIKPNKITFVCLIKACSTPEFLVDGKLLHSHIIQRCLHRDLYVGSALVDMYLKCGSIKCAREVFYEISQKTAVLWNRMVVGHVENGRNKEALKVFHHMRRRHGIEPSEASWVHVLKACGNLVDLEEGRLLHACMCRSEIVLGGCIGQELVHMYIKCGSLADARHVFDQLQCRPAALWMCVIKVYSECGDHEEASKLTCQMQQMETFLVEPIISEISMDDEEGCDFL